MFFLRWRGESGGLTALPVASVSRRGSSVPLLAADIPCPCLLLPKSDRKQGKRGERMLDCRRAPEAARRSPHTDKVVQKVVTEVTAEGFTEKKSLTTTVSSFAKLLLSCQVLKSTVGICGMQWRGRGLGGVAAFCTFMKIIGHQ